MLTTLRFQARARLFHRPTIVPFGSRSRVEAVLDGASSKRAAYYCLPDFPEMRAWQAHLRPFDLFVDVGANIGLYSLVAAEQDAQVIAIEPAEKTASQLLRNLQLNGIRADVRQVALADRPGTMWLSGEDANRAALTTSSEPDGDAEKVTVTTLDEVLDGRRAAGVKIDVEGFERRVLEGARNSLGSRSIDLLQLEWNTTSLDSLGEDRRPVGRLLREAGYELLRPDPTGVLMPIAGDDDFGPDVFARPAP